MGSARYSWPHYVLVLTLCNCCLHVCYVYFLMQAHDTMDHTQSNIYTFEQALLLCKREMIYREAGVAVKRALEQLNENMTLQIDAPNREIDDEEHPAEMSSLPMHAQLDQGVYDRWRLFKVHNFAVTGDKWSEYSGRQVCIGTHSSLDRMHWIVQMANRWKGPLSVALFLPDVEYSIALIFIKFLRNCYPAVRDQVSFHIIYPDEYPPKNMSHLEGIIDAIPCESPHVVIGNLLTLRPVEMTVWRETLRYPQNLARNTGKQGCQTPFSIVPDADMIPSAHMAEKLEEFLAREEVLECDKCAYVIPVYEIKSAISRDSMPANKTELLFLLERYFARRFHQTVYLLNQLSSDLDKWESIPDQNTTEVGYEVEHFLFKYEPLYVTRSEVPIFDERFIGFGMTRNTQAYEMFVAGYRFLVLNNLMMNHWGLQKRETRPKWRQMQHFLNNRLFKGFAREIAARYNRDPYNMLQKMEMPGFWGVKNITDIEFGVPGHAQLSELYKETPH